MTFDLDWNTVGIFSGLIIAVIALSKYFTTLDMRVKQLEEKLKGGDSMKTQESVENPMNILERRLANGDITEEEFDNKIKRLKKKK